MNGNAIWARLVLPVAILTFASGAVLAEDDPSAVLKRAARAMGADELKTLRYVGRGQGASFGQAYRPGTAWPKLNYSNYERLIDYNAPASIERVMRGRAEPRGGGAVPLAGEAMFGAAVSGDHAWNITVLVAAPRQAAHAARLHDIWITPHGAIKAAQKGGGARLAWRTVGGKEMAAVSYSQPGVLSATALINPDYLVERVESRVSDNVMGDIPVVTTYSEYRDFGGVKFPTRIEQTQAGFMVLSITVSEVQPNASVAIEVPANVRTATERVTTDKAADGVWFVAGGSHNSVAIEMKDHVVLVEAPLYDGRTLAVFDAVRKVTGKPIRYVVNSHGHFDHSGGLRAAVSEGATLIVERQSKPYFQKVLANPNRITPDALARSGKKAKIMAVNDKHVLSDGTRTVELHKIKDSIHSDTFLMAYLPKEKVLAQADAFTPGPPNAKPPAVPNAYHVNLVQNIERLKLDVQTILPLHSRMVPVGELYKAIGR